MKEQKIVIEIDHEGKLTADAEGFTGDACLKEIDRLLEGIAASREIIEHKPEADDQRLANRGRRTQSTEKKR